MTRSVEVVEIEVEPADVDWVSGLVWSAGVTAVQERAAGGRVVLVTGPDSAALRVALGGRWPVRTVPVDDSVLDRWKAFAVPVAVGRLLVVPGRLGGEGAGDDRGGAGARRPDQVVVRIDPVRTFGHGGHPTTRAVLGEVERRVRHGSTVLDVGCGSGVLAVTAAALGGRRVVAIDVDPDAVAVTVANARANAVDGVVEASADPLAAVAGRFDLVVANLGADLLVELAPELQARVAAGGALVLSGLLADRRNEVVAAYPGWTVVAEAADDGWCTLTISPGADEVAGLAGEADRPAGAGARGAGWSGP